MKDSAENKRSDMIKIIIYFLYIISLSFVLCIVLRALDSDFESIFLLLALSFLIRGINSWIWKRLFTGTRYEGYLKAVMYISFAILCIIVISV